MVSYNNLISFDNYTFMDCTIWFLIVGDESKGSNDCYSSVLYVWSGQDTSVANAADFVAVIDFDEKSSAYGQIIKRVSLVTNVKR